MHQNVPLEVWVTRLPQWPAQRKFAIQRPGRVHSLNDVAHSGQHHCGQPRCLKNVGERTHGTRAERSDRGEKNHVHLIGDQFGGTSWTTVQANLSNRVRLVTSKREVSGGHLTNKPLVG